jgi:RNA recognition motif-containing protein
MDVSIYVGNLSYNTDEEDLRSLFSQAGTVVNINLITDRDTGRSKGFAFIEMTTQVEAENAIKMFNGTMVDERQMKVNIARPQKKRGSYRRGGGYRSY